MSLIGGDSLIRRNAAISALTSAFGSQRYPTFRNVSRSLAGQMRDTSRDSRAPANFLLYGADVRKCWGQGVARPRNDPNPKEGLLVRPGEGERYAATGLRARSRTP
jgi:hypothetical protein